VQNLNNAIKRYIKKNHPSLKVKSDEKGDGFDFVYGEDSPDILIKEINHFIKNHPKIERVEYVVYDDCMCYGAIAKKPPMKTIVY